MGNDLGGGEQRTGKRLMKAKTASAPEENTKPWQSRRKKGSGNPVLLVLAHKITAKRGEHGSNLRGTFDGDCTPHLARVQDKLY